MGRTYKKLSLGDRRVIERTLALGGSLAEAGRLVGSPAQSVSAEAKRGGGKAAYRAEAAEAAASERRTACRKRPRLVPG